MADGSLNYAFIMERFIEERAKSPEKAASYLAITVAEVNDILATGNVSVKTGRALERMSGNLDLSERREEVETSADSEGEMIAIRDQAQGTPTQNQSTDQDTEQGEHVPGTAVQSSKRAAPDERGPSHKVGAEADTEDTESREDDNTARRSSRRHPVSSKISERVKKKEGEEGRPTGPGVSPETGQITVGGTRAEGGSIS